MISALPFAKLLTGTALKFADQVHCSFRPDWLILALKSASRKEKYTSGKKMKPRGDMLVRPAPCYSKICKLSKCWDPKSTSNPPKSVTKVTTPTPSTLRRSLRPARPPTTNCVTSTSSICATTTWALAISS